MKSISWMVFIATLFICPAASAEKLPEPLKAPFNHSLFDQFLKKYVNEKGEVAYGLAKTDPSLLNRYLKKINKISNLALWPREEKMALYLNAYHAGLIKKILELYPLESVQKVPAFWQMDVVKVGGQSLNLNKIRDLFFGYGDPKTQLALSYGARSGPRLSREAFNGPQLEGQLFLAAQQFVNDSQENQIVPGEKKVFLSQIFQWQARMFSLNFGAYENELKLTPEELSILSFVRFFLQEEEKIRYLEEGGYKVKFSKFDWTLNDWKNAPA